MSDYSKAVIYSLKSEEDIFDSNIYIGSTCDLKKRITAHKSSMKNIKSADSHTKRSKYFKKTNGSFVYGNSIKNTIGDMNNIDNLFLIDQL